jgi:hypothetical protein
LTLFAQDCESTLFSMPKRSSYAQRHQSRSSHLSSSGRKFTENSPQRSDSIRNLPAMNTLTLLMTWAFILLPYAEGKRIFWRP